MADDQQSAEWDEVGRLFGELGRSLQQAWSASKPEKVVDEAEEGARSVGAVVDDLKTSITRTVSDPNVREAAGKASSGVGEALATNLRQLADWIDQRASTAGDTGTGTGTGTGTPTGTSTGTPAAAEAVRPTQTEPPAEG